ncbi:MAG TPA: glycosyltransferase family 39 protein [Bacteroidales bacterium]|nr:glycosyltransferase family 39 protein [Bacteroidales bacterium]
MLSFKQFKTLSAENNLALPFLLVLILVIPAFFINLGLIPFNEDESTRGLVSIEMHLSGNYITPTVGGSLYFNKPPLFNWMVIFFCNLGGHNELMQRFPTVISLLLFSLTIFITVRRHLGDRIAFTSALLFLTCGRILTYESLKGLIDIIFSWVLFLNFMVIYNGLKEQKPLKAFALSYFLLFLAFMFKGLPALVFQAFTVLFLAFHFYRWKFFSMLLSMRHLAALLFFLIPTGIYYLIYFSQNPGTLDEMIAIIFQQSARRTAIRFGWDAMLMHLVTYPFEFIGHFMPWTLLVIFFFFRKSRQLLNQHLVQALLWVFLLNITVYWASPESFARYVLMLVPMIYIVMVYLYESDMSSVTGKRIFYYLFLSCIVLIMLTTLSIPFLNAVDNRSWVIPKVIFLLAFEGLILYLFLKHKRNTLIYTAIFLLVVRIGFDWFVLPHRYDRITDAKKKAAAVKIGKFVKDDEVYVYGKPFRYFDEDVSPKYVSFFTRFYISAQTGKIIRDTTEIKPGYYYLVTKEDLVGKEYTDYSGAGATLDKIPRFLVKFKR